MKKLNIYLNLLFFAVFLLSSISCTQNKGTEQGTQPNNPTPTPDPNPGPNPPTPPAEIYEHLTILAVIGGRNNGVLDIQEFEDREELNSILKGEVKEIEVLGVAPTVYFLSDTDRFESVKVNGQGVKINYNQGDFVSNVAYVVKLVDLNQMTLSFEILADGGKKSKGKIKLIRKAEKADVPLDALLINNKLIKEKGKDIIQELSCTDSVTIEKIIENGKVSIQVCSLLPFIKEVKFNDDSVQSVKKQIGTLFYQSVAEKTMDVSPNTKIKIEIIPIREDLFKPVTWHFTVVD